MPPFFLFLFFLLLLGVGRIGLMACIVTLSGRRPSSRIRVASLLSSALALCRRFLWVRGPSARLCPMIALSLLLRVLSRTEDERDGADGWEVAGY